MPKSLDQLKKPNLYPEATQPELMKLQKKLALQQTYIDYLDAQVDIMLEEKIHEYDHECSIDRDFKLISSRKYEKECIALYEKVFKKKISLAFWHWKYRPYGMNYRGICAISKGKIIGHYNGMARKILFFGEEKMAVAIGDTMLAPEARGSLKHNSPFYSMSKIFTEMTLGPKKKFSLAYGFPLKRVMRLAERIGLYTKVDSMTEVSWNISEYKSNEALKISAYTHIEPHNYILNNLWEQMAIDFRENIIGARDKNYILHRYLTHPVFQYATYLIFDTKDEVKAFIALKLEGNSVTLMDIVAKKENFGNAINGALALCKSNDINYLKCWITTSQKDLFSKYNAILQQTDTIIPTYKPGHIEPKIIKNKWFLMYGESDFK